jgi:hypothetical protein
VYKDNIKMLFGAQKNKGKKKYSKTKEWRQVIRQERIEIGKLTGGLKTGKQTGGMKTG